MASTWLSSACVFSILVWSTAAAAEQTGRVLGDPAAPVKIIEYTSLSCSRCATFHNDRLPWLKKTYIDTGKAHLEFRDFPINQPALFGAMVAHCVAPDRYFDMIDHLFAVQDRWAFGPYVIAELKAVAGEAGMSGDDFDRCLADEVLRDRIVHLRATAEKEFEIRATPWLIIGDRMLEPVPSIELLTESIELAVK